MGITVSLTDNCRHVDILSLQNKSINTKRWGLGAGVLSWQWIYSHTDTVQSGVYFPSTDRAVIVTENIPTNVLMVSHLNPFLDLYFTLKNLPFEIVLPKTEE